MCQYHVRRERSQLRCMSTNVGGIRRGPTSVDPHVAADAPARLLQPLQKRSNAGLKLGIVRRCRKEYADAPHLVRVLRSRHERPGYSRTAEQRDELAPPDHSI